MNVIVHYPNINADIIELSNIVAKVHAQAVISYLQKLNCPKTQKIKLLKEIKEALNV